MESTKWHIDGGIRWAPFEQFLEITNTKSKGRLVSVDVFQIQYIYRSIETGELIERRTS